MKKQQSSITAEGIAFLRALESERPAGERICYDPYAQYFVSPWLAFIGRPFMKMGYGQRKGPGVQEFLVARARYMDDCLEASLREGLQQLVILGAGYDSRAYRIEGLEGRVKVFEVDHPATQRVKLQRLKKIFGAVPAHVIYVPVDFESETLEKRLYESGYDRRLKTLFIWEGVVCYLTPEAVDDTLAFVANHSGAGSSIVFDYIYDSVIKGIVKRGEATAMRRNQRWTGEALVYGIEEGKVTEFLEHRGFYQVKDATNVDLKRAYFTGVNQNREVAYGYAIASATVKPRE